MPTMLNASITPATIAGPEWSAQYWIRPMRGLRCAATWPLSAGVSACSGPTSGASLLTPDRPM